MSAELTIVQNIATTKDKLSLQQLDPEWFTQKEFNWLIQLWKHKPEYLDPVILNAYLSRLEIKKSLNVKEIYSKPKHDVEVALKTVQDDYLRGLLNHHLTQLKEDIKHLDPSIVMYRVSTLINKMPVFQTKQGDFFDGLEQENPDLLKLAVPRRPMLKKLITEYGNIMVIGGDSGHQKTNQLLDLLDCALEANISDPNFKVAFFSKEQKRKELLIRLMSKKLRVPQEDLILRIVDVEDLKKQFEEKFPEWVTRFRIYDPEEWIGADGIVREMVVHKYKVWGVDYLQLAAGENEDLSKQNVNVMSFMRSMKVIVRISNSFGILLSQFVKKDQRALIHRPSVDMLEWSNEVQRLASFIGLLFWAWKVFPQECDIRWYWVNWQKNRTSKPFNEILKSEPEFCDFVYDRKLITLDGKNPHPVFSKYKDL